MMMKSVFNTFRNDRCGVAAIEFAILAPVLIVMICAPIDLGYVYLAQTSLTGSVTQSARSNSVTQESSQSAREAVIASAVTTAMSGYMKPKDMVPTVATSVYRKFGDSFPEKYIDANANGRYDPPSSDYGGDPFTDRNGNGSWDAELPIAGTTGNVGDVVRITATFPLAHPFGVLTNLIGWKSYVFLTASTVVRNEAVKTT